MVAESAVSRLAPHAIQHLLWHNGLARQSTWHRQGIHQVYGESYSTKNIKESGIIATGGPSIRTGYFYISMKQIANLNLIFGISQDDWVYLIAKPSQ